MHQPVCPASFCLFNPIAPPRPLVLSLLSEFVAHHDVERLPLEPGPFAQRVGVELGGQAPQELWLQDVAAEAVGQEAALVQVHLLGGRLEVQGH